MIRPVEVLRSPGVILPPNKDDDTCTDKSNSSHISTSSSLTRVSDMVTELVVIPALNVAV